MSERLKPYYSRVPTKFEIAFSFVVVSIVTLMGLLILFGTFGIGSSYRVTLGLILVGYGLIRFLMLKSKYKSVKRKDMSLDEVPKEDGTNLRNP
ncbi:MAG: hypothetical protein JSV10_08140 [Candidatus Zixiibacteriota bacterium]|nr:MAG: hypothetical protein JSV10_08140 [candidate division Zixibacteria bacterium]